MQLKNAVLASAVLLSLGLGQCAQASEWMVFDGYYTRGDPKSCAEGAYEVRDARDLEAVKAAKKAMGAEKRYRNGSPADYKRGKVVAIYSYTTKDVNYMGSGSCTYTAYNSLSASSTLEAERAVMRRPKEYPSSFLSAPSIVRYWQGEDVDKP